MIVNCASIRGRSHIEQDRPCQDSSGFWTHGNFSLIVVSDGHGGSEYARSDRGSRLAVQVTIEVLSDLMSKRSFLKAVTDGQYDLMDVKESIISKWRDAVKKDISDEKNSDSGEHTLKEYGATLVIAAIVNDYILCLQIGDGAIYMIHSDGRIDMALEIDRHCIGNVTTSLCDENPLSSFHHVCKRNKDVVGLFVCTDGYTSSYNPDEIQNPIRHIASKMDVNGKWYTDIIPGLIELSSKASKDDVSVAVCCDESSNFELFESLCTNRIPSLEHHGQEDMRLMSKVRTDCSLKDGEILESGTSFDGVVFIQGIFKDGSFETGVVWYPRPEELHSIPISGVLMPDKGIVYEKTDRENKLYFKK